MHLRTVGYVAQVGSDSSPYHPVLGSSTATGSIVRYFFPYKLVARRVGSSGLPCFSVANDTLPSIGARKNTPCNPRSSKSPRVGDVATRPLLSWGPKSGYLIKLTKRGKT